MMAVNYLNDTMVDANEFDETSDIKDIDFEESTFFDEELYHIVFEYRHKAGGDPYVYWSGSLVLLHTL